MRVRNKIGRRKMRNGRKLTWVFSILFLVKFLRWYKNWVWKHFSGRFTNILKVYPGQCVLENVLEMFLAIFPISWLTKMYKPLNMMNPNNKKLIIKVGKWSYGLITCSKSCKMGYFHSWSDKIMLLLSFTAIILVTKFHCE